jgi:NAD(P)-dependent dehydrogenase (short-subunit alcohol dehydrogenase family)
MTGAGREPAAMPRIALITGGAQGLGAAAARRLVRDGFAGIVLLDRNARGLAATRKTLSPARVETIAVDLADRIAPAAAVAAALEAFGRIDVLVNAAGNTERCGLDDTTEEAFDRLFDVNVKAPFFLMQEAARAMRKAGSGTIVNISSMLAHGGPANLVTYTGSKAALVAITRSAANAVKRDGIRIHAINLGWTHSEGEQALQTSFHGMPEDWAEHIGRRMPAGRLITPDDVAGLIAYLASPEARMMNGAVIDFEQMPVGTFDTHPALAPE